MSCGGQHYNFHFTHTIYRFHLKLGVFFPPRCSLAEQRPEPAPRLQGASDGPSKHAQRTYLGQNVLSAPFTAGPCDPPGGNKQDVPDQQQSLSFTSSLWCAD